MPFMGFVRHGRTSWNIERRSQGHSENPLDDEGFEQAEKVALRLRSMQWDMIISSDLLRARQTAQMIAARLGFEKLTFDANLRELDRGRISGTTEPERLRIWGPDWRSLDMGLESPEEGGIRGARYFESLAAQYPEARILVVSHGELLRYSLERMIPDLPTEEKLKNTSVTLISHELGQWCCHLYNCTAHLDG